MEASSETESQLSSGAGAVLTSPVVGHVKHSLGAQVGTKHLKSELRQDTKIGENSGKSAAISRL